MPPFAAEYAAWPIWPSMPAIDDVMTMTPRSLSSSGSSFAICAAARRETLNVPLRNVFTVNSKPSSDAGEPSRPTMRPPAPALAAAVHRDAQRSAARRHPHRLLHLFGRSSTSVRTNSVPPPSSAAIALPALLVEVGDHDVGAGRGQPPDAWPRRARRPRRSRLLPHRSVPCRCAYRTGWSECEIEPRPICGIRRQRGSLCGSRIHCSFDSPGGHR